MFLVDKVEVPVLVYLSSQFNTVPTSIMGQKASRLLRVIIVCVWI